MFVAVIPSIHTLLQTQAIMLIACSSKFGATFTKIKCFLLSVIRLFLVFTTSDSNSYNLLSSFCISQTPH
ncbi:MAG: hypothetical protein LBQ24_04480 [Candidatus Peribacteria bacterium]|nr:hypothetical protein [Candidatus Peribacteria bacterium]